MKIINDSLQVLRGLKKGLPCPVCGRQRSVKTCRMGSVLMTGELSRLLDDLIEVLGGEVVAK